MGGRTKLDYVKLAPPGSFIHVDDFSTPEHLAKHLIHLDGNPEEYNKYHLWRKAFSGDFWVYCIVTQNPVIVTAQQQPQTQQQNNQNCI